MYTEQFSETHKLLISNNSPTLAAGTYDTSWVSLANYHRAAVVLHVIDMGAGATINLSARQATDTAGTSAKAFTTAKAITALTQAGGDVDSDVCMEIRTEEMDVTGGFDCLGLRLVVAVANVVVSWHVFGIVPRYAPVGVTEWTEVVE